MILHSLRLRIESQPCFARHNQIETNIINMKRVSDDEWIDYFDCLYFRNDETEARMLPKNASWWEKSKNPDPYRIPMTKEQFFEDRPWLTKDDKHYEDYIKNSMRISSEIRKEKADMWKENNFKTLKLLFLMKKLS
jgi:uncharacterized short protein YbdD (DUF466 family)